MASRRTVATRAKAPAKAPARYAKQAIPRVIRGRGDYYVGGDVSGGINLGKLGHARASLYGGYSKGNAVIPKISGRGTYFTSPDVLSGDPPQFRNSSKKHPGATVISHREYIQTMVSSSTSGGFKVDSFPLNPGMSQTFPFLSTVAVSWQEYEIIGMVFELKSICSEAISSASLATIGEVCMATSYNAIDPAFSSFQQMANQEFAQAGRVSDRKMIHMIECDPRQVAVSSRLYVRSGAPASNADLRLYDHGTLYIGSQNVVGASVSYAELWCTYQIALRVPRIPSGPSSTGSNVFKWTGVPNQNAPLGTSATKTYLSTNNMSVTVGDAYLTLPTTPNPTSYLIYLGWSGYNSMVSAYNTFTNTNCVRVKVWLGNTVAVDYAPQIGVAGVSSTAVAFIVTTSAGLTPTISLSNTVAWAGSVVIDGLVTEVAYLDPSIYGTG